MLDDSFLSPEHFTDAMGSEHLGPRGLWAADGSGGPDLHSASLHVHVHAGVEVGVVLSGGEDLYFPDGVLTCGPGDVWLCASWEPHGFCYVLPGSANVVLRFPPEFVGEELLGDVPWLTLFSVPSDQRPRVTSPGLRRRVLEIGESLRREISNRPPCWDTIVRLELLRLLTELNRNWDAADSATGLRHVRVSTMARIMPALNLVHSRPWRRVGVAEAAAACGLSVSAFHAIFRSIMGMSFGRFGLRARLSLAAHQLIRTDRPVTAVAEDAGFIDGSHLRRCFRKQYGCTPAEYRKGSGALPEPRPPISGRAD